MKNILRLKFLFSLLLVGCLFAPLSQCTTVDTQGNTIIQQNYVFKSATDVESWFSALAVVAPLGITLLSLRRRARKIACASLSALFGAAALYVCFLRAFIPGTMLLGGYIALSSSLSFFVLALIEIGFTLGSASGRTGLPPD
jgi:hypothetical protein